MKRKVVWPIPHYYHFNLLMLFFMVVQIFYTDEWILGRYIDFMYAKNDKLSCATEKFIYILLSRLVTIITDANKREVSIKNRT